MITKLTTAVILCLSLNAQATEQVCEVQVCNKLERFSLDLWSHVKDHMGEVCFDIIVPESQAIVGKVLSSKSKWYQGSSLNITKESVTRIKEVYSCTIVGE